MTGTETVAFRMQLQAGHQDEYQRRHDAIWPELEALLRASGVVEYRIFLDRHRSRSSPCSRDDAITRWTPCRTTR